MLLVRNKTFLVLTILLIGAGFFMYAFSKDLMCVNIGLGEPNKSYYTNTSAWKDVVSKMRVETLDALLRQFNGTTGFFIYNEHPDGTVANANNDIRQLLASRVVAEASVHDESLRSMHEQNISAIISSWYREEDGVGYVYADRKSKLGANAMLLRVLVASPLFSQYENEARMLVKGILAQAHEDGSFEPWFKEPSYTYDKDYLLTFYSGEATLALFEYAEKTGDRKVFDAAKKSEDFYLGEYVERLNENYYPAYVPWHTLALAKLYIATKDEKYAEAIFTLTDKLLEMQDTTKFAGRFYSEATPEYGTPHASTDAVYTEGLATAYEVAHLVGNTDKEVIYKDALVRAVYNLESLQFSPSPLRIFDNDVVGKKLTGGIMTNVCSRWTRIDSTAHTIDALTNILRVF